MLFGRPYTDVGMLLAVPKRERTPDAFVKTTVELPSHLWRAAKIRAMDERTDLRTVLIRALERFLDAPEARQTTRSKNRE